MNLTQIDPLVQLSNRYQWQEDSLSESSGTSDLGDYPVLSHPSPQPLQHPVSNGNVANAFQSTSNNPFNGNCAATATQSAATAAMTEYRNNKNIKMDNNMDDHSVFHTKEHLDFHSAMYHQHVVAANQSMSSVPPARVVLLQKVHKMAGPSASNSHTCATVSRLGTIRVITKTTTTTSLSTVDDIGSEEYPIYNEPRVPSMASFSNPSSEPEVISAPIHPFNPKEGRCRQYSQTSVTDEAASLSPHYNEPRPNGSKAAFVFDQSGFIPSSHLKTPMPLKKKKRTVTSYDDETAFYLRSLFYEIYSIQPKLTKLQRAEIQARTGLPSRNITYWFSNHKRRFHQTLDVYRKAVKDSRGSIKTYTDFINWRRDHNLPDQITQEEVRRLKSQI